VHPLPSKPQKVVSRPSIKPISFPESSILHRQSSSLSEKSAEGLYFRSPGSPTPDSPSLVLSSLQCKQAESSFIYPSPIASPGLTPSNSFIGSPSQSERPSLERRVSSEGFMQLVKTTADNFTRLKKSLSESESREGHYEVPIKRHKRPSGEFKGSPQTRDSSMVVEDLDKRSEVPVQDDSVFKLLRSRKDPDESLVKCTVCKRKLKRKSIASHAQTKTHKSKLTK